MDDLRQLRRPWPIEVRGDLRRERCGLRFILQRHCGTSEWELETFHLSCERERGYNNERSSTRSYYLSSSHTLFRKRTFQSTSVYRIYIVFQIASAVQDIIKNKLLTPPSAISFYRIRGC